VVLLAVFTAELGVSIIPPYRYEVYIVPGLLGIVLLFHGIQSALSMVYDRGMGMMGASAHYAPLSRW
jgi:ABC-2 type transport system permease protein